MSTYETCPTTEFSAEHEASFVRRVSKNLMARYRNWQTLRTNRDAFLYLTTLDDHTLKDIGYTREQIFRASKLPLDVNAALEVRKSRVAARSSGR